ncbi:hypothetical protein GCM10017687_56340 [Streptomyces echinatus]
MCIETPSTRQDSSAPVTRVSPSGSAPIASAYPRVVSWSVSATTSSPAAAAWRTSSAGVSVPSEAVEWQCRSMRTTAPGGDGGKGTPKDSGDFNPHCHSRNRSAPFTSVPRKGWAGPRDQPGRPPRDPAPLRVLRPEQAW